MNDNLKKDLIRLENEISELKSKLAIKKVAYAIIKALIETEENCIKKEEN